MRDLQRDLDICEKATPLRFAVEAREGWPEAIRRDIEAEARNEELYALWMAEKRWQGVLAAETERLQDIINNILGQIHRALE